MMYAINRRVYFAIRVSIIDLLTSRTQMEIFQMIIYATHFIILNRLNIILVCIPPICPEI